MKCFAVVSFYKTVLHAEEMHAPLTCAKLAGILSINLLCTAFGFTPLLMAVRFVTLLGIISCVLRHAHSFTSYRQVLLTSWPSAHALAAPHA